MEDGGALSHWEEEKDLFLEVLLPDPSQDDIGCRYPAEPCLILFRSSGSLPGVLYEVSKYIMAEGVRLSVATPLAPVLFELSSWLQTELPAILANIEAVLVKKTSREIEREVQLELQRLDIVQEEQQAKAGEKAEELEKKLGELGLDTKKVVKECSTAEVMAAAAVARLSAAAHAKADLGELEETSMSRASENIQREHEKAQQKPAYRKMLQSRAKLPAAKKKTDFLAALANHQVVVVSGETGCGKTTQVPQFILDEEIEAGRGAKCSIICTQPRRISAIGVSERVAAERNETIGQTVGYQIRLEKKKSHRTRLLFCTTGVLLRRLHGDPTLDGVSHVVVDEVHERSMDGDFLLIILRDLLAVRHDLKLVLMSATINAELFCNYFGGAEISPSLHIPGFTHPVQEWYLEDILEETGFIIEADSPDNIPRGGRKKSKAAEVPRAQDMIGQAKAGNFTSAALSLEEESKRMAELYQGYSSHVLESLSNMEEDMIQYHAVEELISYIGNNHDEGAVLVFMPGLMEINTLYEACLHNEADFPRNEWLFLPLHGSLDTDLQTKIFNRPPAGVRKVVISTNVAETSITIDDVVFVIDCGRVKENRYDPVNKMPQLIETWYSAANARQRRGRAGRVQPGQAFFMYTRERQTQLDEFQTPEMLRVPLSELCLQICVLQLGDPQDFLAKAIEPPSKAAVAAAMSLLVELKAVDPSTCLTPLGYHLAALPVDVRIGKLMIHGAIFRCLDPVLAIAAIMSFRSPFNAPMDKRDAANLVKRQMALGKSDHLSLLRAYYGWLQAREMRQEREFCRKRFLSVQTLRMIHEMKSDFLKQLVEIGFVEASPSLSLCICTNGLPCLLGTG